MYDTMKYQLQKTLEEIHSIGLYKQERVLATAQGPRISVVNGREVLNFCANNYLGLANNPQVLEKAGESLISWGYGMASVRFICGTQALHKQLEATIADFLGTDDAILYSSCFDANGGLFEALLGPDDAIISDELNHASIIDGIRLCKAKRLRYKNADLADLEIQLKAAGNARMKLIASDGVFSMDGSIAPLKDICDLADRYDAAVMIDDSHATGVIGKTGRGTPEYCGVPGRVDIITGTFGKALGGASGGFTAGRQEIIDLLRQRSRPYLFSNSLAPLIAATTLSVLQLLNDNPQLPQTLQANARYFRDGMKQRGFEIPEGEHPIVPIMLGDATLATRMAELLLEEGIYVIGFSYPVVPKGQARIRVQISAAHTTNDLNLAIVAFDRVRQKL